MLSKSKELFLIVALHFSSLYTHNIQFHPTHPTWRLMQAGEINSNTYIWL